MYVACAENYSIKEIIQFLLLPAFTISTNSINQSRKKKINIPPVSPLLGIRSICGLFELVV